MEEEIAKSTFTLKEIGPWVLGFIALVQVWVIALWKKLRKGRIEIYETGLIEIGYGDLGPSIGLIGTLRCIDKDVFVKRISVSVIRKKDGAQHVFMWYAFRPFQLPLGEKESQNLEIASSFLATPSQPHKFNIFFTDNAFVSEYRPKVQPLIKSWHDFINQKPMDMSIIDAQKSKTEYLSNPALLKSLFDEFSNLGLVASTYSILDRAFYWEAGRYELTVIIEASNPDRNFTKSWHFDLTQGDTDRIRLNTIATLQSICGLQVTYNFAYPEYQMIESL